MLQQMRTFAKSWVASIFMGALALSFGVWGIADIFTGTADTTAAKVGSVEISQAEFQRDYQNVMRNQSARLGKQLTPEMAQAMGLGNSTLESMISRTAVDTHVRSLGLTATDDAVAQQIRAIPGFAGPTGSFDHQTFLQAINRAGFDEQGFIEAIRADTARDQLDSALKNGLQAPAGYVRALFDYLNEVRAVHYVVVPAKAAGTPPTPTDAELSAFMRAHPAQFSTPEYREFSYAAVTPADLKGDITVSDKDLHNEFLLRKDEFQIPEKRDIEQITFPDEKAAAAASAQIEKGKSFEDVAKARGLKQSDYQIGELTEVDLGGDRGKAAFALKEGEISKPVKGIFGYVLLKVTKIIPGVSKSFDDVKEKLRQDAFAKLAQSKISDIVNAFEDAMAGGDKLEAAAKAVGMRYVHVKSMDKSGLAEDGSKAAVPANSDFLAQVFAADVGVSGDPFQVADGSAYVLQVDGDTPPKLKPLADVREKAVTQWTEAEHQKALLAKAESLAKQATADKSVAGIAKSLGVSALTSQALQRGRPADPFEADLLAKIFEAPPGTAVFGKAKDGNFVVARITGVIHPPPMTSSAPQYRGFAAQIGMQIGNDIPTSFAMAARKKQGVEIHQKIVDGVTGAGS